MKKALQNVIAWIVVSSADPEEVSLSVKALIVGTVPTIMAVAGLAHVNLGDGSLLTSLFDMFAQAIQSILTLVALAMGIYGMLRKVYHLVVPANTVAGPQS